MSDSLFPTFKGITWPITKRASWNTLANQAESGREVRVGLWSAPMYEWDLPFGMLNATDLTTFWGFYNARGGSFDTFLFVDQVDNYALGAALGLGNGTNTVFQLNRSQGGLFIEARNDIQQTPAPKIYLNGFLQATTAYSIAYSNSGIVTFVTAPASGVVVSASFYFYYRVKFKEDSLELDLEAQVYATGQKVTLAQVRGDTGGSSLPPPGPPAPDSAGILLEDGANLLNEDGTRVLMEGDTGSSPPAPSSADILSEDGSNLLNEDGTRILTED
jgi:uncharacterized protein (TIGR02217 family)